jgi:hypothetical protein
MPHNLTRLERLERDAAADAPPELVPIIVLPPDVFTDQQGNLRLPEGSPNTLPVLPDGPYQLVSGGNPEDWV